MMMFKLSVTSSLIWFVLIYLGQRLEQVSTSTTQAYSNTITVSVELPPGCWCTCSDLDNTTITMTDDQLTSYRDKVFIEVQKTLLIDKQTLSSMKRLKYSATDNRILSTTFGYTGVVSLVLVFLVLLWMDSTYIQKFAMSLGFTLKSNAK